MASIERSNSKSSQILNNHLHASCRASISMSTCFRTARGAPELKPLFGRPSNLPNVRFPPLADISGLSLPSTHCGHIEERKRSITRGGTTSFGSA